MLVNPGGPGGSGLALASLRDVIPHDAGKGYDWIGFDPRGVGAEQTRHLLRPEHQQGPRPVLHAGITRRETQPWRGRLVGAVQEVRGSLWAEISRPAGAHERPSIPSATWMPSGRRSRVENQLLRLSPTATYLGQVYATMFPKNVEEWCSDGNVDHAAFGTTPRLSQDRAFEVVIQKFFEWGGAQRRHLQPRTTGTEVRGKYNAALHALAAAPVGRHRFERVGRRVLPHHVRGIPVGPARPTRSPPTSTSTTSPPRRSTTRARRTRRQRLRGLQRGAVHRRRLGPSPTTRPGVRTDSGPRPRRRS